MSWQGVSLKTTSSRPHHCSARYDVGCFGRRIVFRRGRMPCPSLDRFVLRRLVSCRPGRGDRCDRARVAKEYFAYGIAGGGFDQFVARADLLPAAIGQQDFEPSGLHRVGSNLDRFRVTSPNPTQSIGHHGCAMFAIMAPSPHTCITS